MRISPKRAVALVLTLMVAVSFCGCGGVVGQALSINSARAILTNDWSSDKALVKILADVVGYTAVTQVIALIKKIGSDESREVILVPNLRGEFEGTFTADENTSTVEPEQYEVTVTATEPGKSVEADPVTVEVPPADDVVPASAGE